MKKILPFLVPLFILSACELQEEKQPAFLDAEGIPIPTHSYVNDFTHKMLDSTERLKLEKKLSAYEDSTTTQVVIVCLQKLPNNKNGATWVLEELSLEIGRTWAIGQKDKNNGVLLLVTLDEHNIRIETGYGVEGALPDITCKKIIDRDISPKFKDEKYYDGLDKSTTSIIQALAGEYEQVAKEEDLMKAKEWAVLIGVGICIIIGLFFIWIATAVGGVYIGIFWFIGYSATSGEAWIAGLLGAVIVLVLSFIARLFLTGSPGSVISSDGISFSGGDGGGGFFSGGGSFGGGGASGSW